jgi:hypothetical protein
MPALSIPIRLRVVAGDIPALHGSSTTPPTPSTVGASIVVLSPIAANPNTVSAAFTRALIRAAVAEVTAWRRASCAAARVERKGRSFQALGCDHVGGRPNAGQ